MNPLELPLFVPVVIVVTVLALVGAGRVARATGARLTVAAALVVAAGVVVAATLTPQASALVYGETGTGACNLARLTPAAPWAYLVFGEALGNVLLFMPLGVTLALMPTSTVRHWLLLGAIASPFLVELAQLVTPMFDRACESADIIDNLLGLAVGFALGWTANRLLGGRLSRPAADA